MDKKTPETEALSQVDQSAGDMILGLLKTISETSLTTGLGMLVYKDLETMKEFSLTLVSMRSRKLGTLGQGV